MRHVNQNAFRTALPPVRAGVCSFGRLGVFMCFSATEVELVKAGVLLRTEIPGLRRGASRRVGDIRAGRCADGRINVTTYAKRSAKLDAGFQDFMHGLLADTQLSTVRGEKPESY